MRIYGWCGARGNASLFGKGLELQRGNGGRLEMMMMMMIIIIIIIIYHDFIPPPRRGILVKSDNKHNHQHTPLSPHT